MSQRTGCFFLTHLISLALQLLLFSHKVQLQPVYTSQPSNPSPVVEGQNLDLQWSYNLNGQSSFLTRFLNITAGEMRAATVAIRNENNNATVQAGFESQFRAVISDTQATLTILAVPRSFNGEKYQLLIVTASPNFFNLASVKVEISVLFKPEDIQLLTNATANLACLSSYLNFTCSVGSANPQVMSYQLLENDAVVDTGGSGMWVRLMSSSGVFAFRCQVNNTLGTANSASVNITVGVPPTIQPVQNETITEGSSLNVSCHASGAPQPVVSWIKISSGQHFDGSVLKLTNINKNQAGEYRCEASNDCENKSRTAMIHVKFAPTVTNQQCPNAVTEGHNATLYCNATGYPVPNIVWLNASSGNVKSHNKTLVLRTVTRNEKGGYVCLASNEIGNSTKTCEINVHYRPSASAIATVPSNTTVLRGSTVSLICTTDASPAANIHHFYFNGSYVGISSSGVFNATARDDGLFTCVPFNSVGTGHNATISVIVVDAPLLQINVTIATVVEGESITLRCDVTGKPKPTITWTRVGSPRVLSYNGILRIVNLNRNNTIDNMIQYQCTASNGVESPVTEIATITVYYPPEITKPQTAEWKIMAGSSASVECLAKGNPRPQYVWTNATGGVITTDKLLRLNSEDDNVAGKYTCTATNMLGSATYTTLVVVTRNEIPIEVRIVNIVYKPDYNNLNSVLAKAFVKDLTMEVTKVYANSSTFNKVEVTKLREGSVIVSLVLYFSTPVTTNEGIAELTNAIVLGTIGRYSVSSLKILDHLNTTTTSSQTPSMITEGTSSPLPPDTTSFQCNEVVWKAITGVVIFINIVLVILLVWQCRKNNKGSAGRKRPYNVARDDAEVYDNDIAMNEVQSPHSRQRKPEYMDLKERTAFEREPSYDVKLTTSQVQHPSHGTDYSPLYPSTRSWEIARNSVTIEKIIGKGAFGQVAKGTAVDIRGRPGKITVAVKMLKVSAPQSDRKDLLSELEVIKTLKPHPHVIRLLGCVTESEPVLVLIEYVPYGDLLGYLRKSRGLNDTYYKDPDIKPQTSLTSQQLMKFAWQIADGMRYLSSRSIIHRDLAARNVLVGEKETCKVTDFGMARDVQHENIYERKTRGRLPVKWTAYEALLFNTYTTKSDVWSYGIVLYEIFTVGGSPYPRMDSKKIANLLQQGYRMPKPQHVDEKLYEIMMNCWKNEPEARPSFIALTKQLKDMENQHQKLINMHIYDNELYAKVEDLNV